MNRGKHGISLMCRVYDVSRHSFNSWRRHGESARRQEDSELFSLINRVFKKHEGCSEVRKLQENCVSLVLLLGKIALLVLCKSTGLKQ